jgi:hypothetical protein
VPEDGSRSVDKIFVSVVFPAPFAPRSATISPLSTVNDTSSSAQILPLSNVLVTRSTSIAGMRPSSSFGAEAIS